MSAKETSIDAEHRVVVALFDARPVALAAVGELRAAGFEGVHLTQGAPGTDAAGARVWDELEHGFGAEDRRLYAEGARRGATLVLVECGARCDLAASILEKNVPIDIDVEEGARTRGARRAAAAERAEKPVRLRVVRRARTIAETIRAIDVLALDLEVDYGQHATPGVSLERFKPVYEYGQRLAAVDARGWDAIEESVCGRFEQRNPGLWSTYRDAVRRGYERALARRQAPLTRDTP